MQAKKFLSLVLGSTFAVTAILNLQATVTVSAAETNAENTEAVTNVVPISQTTQATTATESPVTETATTAAATPMEEHTAVAAENKEVSATTNSNLPVDAADKSDAGKYAVVWKTPVVIYGVALSPAEVAQAKALLGLANVSSLLETTIDKDDLYKYLGNIAPNSDMISSVAVQKREAGFGVRVTIVTPDKVSQVTSRMYESAAISAGVSDCQILVASTRPVTGESALAGVYKAFDLKGEVFDANQMQISRDELSTINAINQSNIAKKGYDKENLDKVVLNTKLALQDQFAASGKSIASEEIAKIINSYLKEYDLDGIVNGEQIDSLTKFFEKFQNTEAINSPSVRKQLELLANKLDTLFKNFKQDAEAAQFWDRIVQFVREVWQAVMDALNSLVSTSS